jgi:polysaccharide export outer membrane protein
MRQLAFGLAALLAALVALAASAAAQGADYRIAPGDQLAIEVLEDESLNRRVLVLPDGSVSFPLAGTIRAGGRTVSQVERALTSRLAPNFANQPNVFVAVVGLAPEEEEELVEEEELLVVYVMGEVNAPGPKEVLPGTTLLQLLSQSGGFTRFAATTRLQLRRRDQSGRERLFRIDYRAISRGALIARDPLIREGDVLIVPERRLFE